MRTPRKDERTIALILGAFCLGIIALFAVACGDPSTDVDDIEVDSKHQASWCFGFPYKLMAFPVNQGAWSGDGAGQEMVAPFWDNGCKAPGTEFGYGQVDGEINLLREVGWSYNTCWTWKGGSTSGIVCNNQSFQCPASACLTEPVTWQLEPTAPNNSINWGWSQWSAIKNYQSAAPGNHGIWPKTPTQCVTTVATPQFNPSPSGGTMLNCRYTMPTYWLRQN